MNPGEQDQNPFRRPSSASSIGTQNASRYFGTRSRYNANRTRNTQLANAQPAQSYFPQAAQMQPVPAYAAPVAQPQRSGGKRKFLLIAAIIAVVGIITAIIVSIGINGGIRIKGMNHSLEDLQALLKDNRDTVLEALATNEIAQENKQKIAIYQIEDEEQYKSLVNTYRDQQTKLNQFKDRLEDFGSISAYDPYDETIDINELMNTLKEITNKLAAFYDKYAEMHIIIADISRSNGDNTQINKLESFSDNENSKALANNYKDYYQKLANYNKINTTNDCERNRKNTECRNISTELSNAKEKIEDGSYSKYLNSIAVELPENSSPLIIMNTIITMRAK